MWQEYKIVFPDYQIRANDPVLCYEGQISPLMSLIKLHNSEKYP